MKIGGYKVDGELILNYLKHLNSHPSERFKDYEVKRKVLHEKIFKSIKISRVSKEGQEFGRKLDEYCESMINSDIINVGKQISNCRNMNELDEAKKELFCGKSHAFDEMRFARQKLEEKGSNECRICHIDLVEGVGRVNDHLTNDESNPICLKCSKERPDESFLVFKKKYWSY